ncbi:hypothetical protein HAL_31980 [Haladaptatus sp. T7]|nr:hypothetical protein HAL_31980 [Haladaptatus sp. T7]
MLDWDRPLEMVFRFEPSVVQGGPSLQHEADFYSLISKWEKSTSDTKEPIYPQFVP